jgi:hypothetical protein
MPTEQYRLLVTFSPEEKERLDALADQLRLKKSELIRRLVAGQRLPDPEALAGWQHIRDLMKINADLARLGNLFKLALDEAPEAELKDRLTTLAGEIAETQGELKGAVVEMRRTLQPRRKQ